MWDSATVGYIAKQMINAEESGFFSPYVDDAQDLEPSRAFQRPTSTRQKTSRTGASLVIPTLPESFKFQNFEVGLEEDATAKGTIICRKRKVEDGESS